MAFVRDRFVAVVGLVRSLAPPWREDTRERVLLVITRSWSLDIRGSVGTAESFADGAIDSAAIQRWFAYRDNRNNTAHDYGHGFAEETLTLLPGFLRDARAIETKLWEKFGDADT